MKAGSYPGRMGPGNGLSAREAIALGANCPARPRRLTRADLGVGQPISLPLQTESQCGGFGGRGSQMESPRHLRSLVLFLDPNDSPEMPVRVTRHPKSAPGQAGMLSVGVHSWGARQQSKTFSAGISMWPRKAPSIPFGVNSVSVTTTPSITALPRNLRSEPKDNKNPNH